METNSNRNEKLIVASYNKTCPVCKTLNSKDASYCSKCGTPFSHSEKTCSHCGGANPYEAGFCQHCGKAFNKKSNQPSPLFIIVALILAVGLFGWWKLAISAPGQPKTDTPAPNPVPAPVPIEQPKQMMKCPICDGYMFDPRDFDVDCFGCQRAGIVDQKRYQQLISMKESEWPYIKKQYYLCPNCGGTKYVGGALSFEEIMNEDLIMGRQRCNFCPTDGIVDAKQYIEIFKIMKEMAEQGFPVKFLPLQKADK